MSKKKQVLCEEILENKVFIEYEKKRIHNTRFSILAGIGTFALIVLMTRLNIMEISLKLSAIIMIPTYCFLFAYAFIMGTWEPKKILTGTIINITIANESYIKKYPEQPVEPTDVIYTIDCGSETHEVYEVFKGCNGGKYKVGDKVFYLYYNEAAEYIL